MQARWDENVFWKHVFGSFRQGLLLGRATAQPVAADLTGFQIHRGAVSRLTTVAGEKLRNPFFAV